MRKSLLLALSVLSLSLAGAAYAQDQGGPTSDDMARLHDALQLNAAQEQAWRGYIAAIAPDPNVEARRRSAANMMRTLPTPRRIDLINAEMEEDMASMRRQGDAVKAFYAQLTPEQQRIFDSTTYQQPQQNQGEGQ